MEIFLLDDWPIDDKLPIGWLPLDWTEFVLLIPNPFIGMLLIWGVPFDTGMFMPLLLELEVIGWVDLDGPSCIEPAGFYY